MSALALLGAIGTLLSTIQALPHLMVAVKDRKPSGSPLGWLLSVVGTVVWMSYGFVSHDVWLMLPGFVTVPVGSTMCVWAWRSKVAMRGRVEVRYVLPVGVEHPVLRAVGSRSAGSVRVAASVAVPPVVAWSDETLVMERPRWDDTMVLPISVNV